MGWVADLGNLPEVVATLVVFTVCLIWVIRYVSKHIVDRTVKSSERTTEMIVKSLDTNTEAVKENSKAVTTSVKHNEEIITNHLSGQAQRDKAREEKDDLVIKEMKGLVTAVEQLNERRHESDPR